MRNIEMNAREKAIRRGLGLLSSAVKCGESWTSECQQALDGALAALEDDGWVNLDYKLPCDVKLPPATTITKGCNLETLIEALKTRERYQRGLTND